MEHRIRTWHIFLKISIIKADSILQYTFYFISMYLTTTKHDKLTVLRINKMDVNNRTKQRQYMQMQYTQLVHCIKGRKM